MHTVRKRGIRVREKWRAKNELVRSVKPSKLFARCFVNYCLFRVAYSFVFDRVW